MSGLTAISAGFRVAAPSDALCIGVLATQVFLDTYATDGIREALAREVREKLSTEAVSALLADPHVTFVVAEHAGHLVAFAELARGTAQALVPAEGAVELKRLYVQEGFTGRGVGTALLRRAEALAAKQGAARLWLTAWIGNARARAFYARRGYRELGSTVYVFQGEQYENRVFSRELCDATGTKGLP
jgi:GNAT superfamily N-acetyltransferase